MSGSILLRVFGMDDRPAKVECPHCGRLWRPPVAVSLQKDLIARFLDDEIDVLELEREIERELVAFADGRHDKSEAA